MKLACKSCGLFLGESEAPCEITCPICLHLRACVRAVLKQDELNGPEELAGVMTKREWSDFVDDNLREASGFYHKINMYYKHCDDPTVELERE